jgi:hypothetical protein
MSNAVNLAQQLYLKAKLKESSEEVSSALAEFPLKELEIQLATSDTRKAFWLNLYNAFSVLLLTENPNIIATFLGRQKHFRAKSICVAGQRLSLNDIEHGMLRRRNGIFFTKLFISTFEKQFRVEALDNRIHFALNCGGRSCPPIRYYEAKKIKQQLDIAARAFLYTEAEYDEAKNEVLLSKILLWYRLDFGGEKGTIALLKKYDKIPENSSPKLRYKKYDWTTDLDAFA